MTALTALLCQSSHAAPPLTIQWGVNNAPPFHILEGYLHEEGLCDVMLQAFNEALPKTPQKHVRYPQGRIAALMQQGEDLCFPCMIRNGDTPIPVIYSDTIFKYPAHGIITRPDVAEDIAANFGNPVDLVEMLKLGNYRYGQPLGRRYGELQPYLERFLHNTPHYTEITGPSANANMLAMVNAERLDFVIDYPMVMNYHREILPIDLVFLPIKQNHQNYVEGAVGCPQTDWGQHVIDRLNDVIPAIQNNQTFQQAKDRWLSIQNP
ncbi:hypothetical protein CWI80_07780 [Pseudidiomarina sediminum]|uniref:ABC transporter substrate-binding protein n=1 Tax=Pseudidiomarina sediminum TaxID=431675 RepID=A0A432Z3M2_9GAMM|nr:hypothetical protein [Pseudidiomarina sediminum]RUO72449.1 hypothetical protein CWI80_07780 [Pseudidiomarina sediminum]